MLQGVFLKIRPQRLRQDIGRRRAWVEDAAELRPPLDCAQFGLECVFAKEILSVGDDEGPFAMLWDVILRIDDLAPRLVVQIAQVADDPRERPASIMGAEILDVLEE